MRRGKLLWLSLVLKEAIKNSTHFYTNRTSIFAARNRQAVKVKVYGFYVRRKILTKKRGDLVVGSSYYDKAEVKIWNLTR